MTEQHSICAYDLDGTLVPGSLSERAFWKLYNDNILNVTDADLETLESKREHGVDHYYNHLFETYATAVKGVKRSAILRAANELAEEDAPRIFPEMREELGINMGSLAICISGSMEDFVKPFARRVGIDIALGSYFYHREGKVDPSRRYVNFVFNKGIRLTSIANSYNATIERAYGDSMNDVPMFELAREPVPVNPGPQLTILAKEREWRIIKTNDYIG